MTKLTTIGLDFGICHTAICGRDPLKIDGNYQVITIDIANNHKNRGGDRIMFQKILDAFQKYVSINMSGKMIALESMSGYIVPGSSLATTLTIRLETLITNWALENNITLGKLPGVTVKNGSKKFNSMYLADYKLQIVGKGTMSQHIKDAMTLVMLCELKQNKFNELIKLC